MKQLKRVLVGIDLADDTDKQLVRYIDFISHYVKPEVIYFVHVEENLDLPSEILDKYPKMKAPYDESMEARIKKLVNKHFKHEDIETHIDAIEGEPLKTLLHWGHVKEVDLLVIGKKLFDHATHVTPQKLARKSDSSILLVSNESEPELKKILVPVDFSEHSRHAMDAAINIGKQISGCAIICQSVYTVPTGYYKMGKSFEEFAGIMKGHAKEKMKKFLEQFEPGDVKISERYTLKEKKSISRNIRDQARKDKVDLVVMGSKGQTRAAHILLGSVTEHLLSLSFRPPILIIKEEGENIGFLKALLQLK